MQKPSTIQMIRAPFLSSIISPLLVGTLLSVSITGQFFILNFVFVVLMGIGLHVATNVYNDIYDTIQGTDKINVHRNEFSGGSGVLLDFPNLMPRMYLLARLGLIAALFSTIVLSFLIEKELLCLLWGLFGLSAFFSKFYTAAPLKLAYRGWGEISVWFAFGPMAILVAAVSQNVGLHNTILAAMPLTGISTLSILLIGQMIDLDADKATGKLGIAARRGNKAAFYLYVAVQLLLCLDVVILSLWFVDRGWPILLALLPYIFIFPKITKSLRTQYANPAVLKKAAGFNVQIHLLFSILLSVGILLSILFNR